MEKQRRGETEAHQTPKWKSKERKSDEGRNRKKMKKEGKRREIVIFKIDTRQRRVETWRLREGGFTRDDCMTEMVLNPTSSHGIYIIHILDMRILFEEQPKPSTNIKTRERKRELNRRRSRGNSNSS